MSKNEFNTFFSKIFCISLYDNNTRWEGVEKQFKKRKINIERFVAVDGRCKKGEKDCRDKLKSFELSYNVKIPVKKGSTMSKTLPAASLTIGTILLLREQVRNKWPRILICEDDIYLNRNILKNFKQGIDEIGRKKWDVLYLGCGGNCGSKGISRKKSQTYKHISPWNENGADDDEFYVHQRNDLRTICYDNYCESKQISEHISKPYRAGGTWCYAYSLAGAKKTLKIIDNNASNHIDQLLMDMMEDGDIKALAFDPPIVMHEDMRGGRVTDIPW
jgi:GR25 family glycosyltransferase involved in LPS biosynthesis